VNTNRSKSIFITAVLMVSLILSACSITGPTGEPPPIETKAPQFTASPIIEESIPTPTSPSKESAEASPPPSPLDEKVASLEGLPIDEFFDQSFKQLLMRSPQTLTFMHLSEQFGVRDDQLDNISDEYIRQTQQLEVAILDLLHTYDREQLTPEQQLSYDIYEWDLDDRIRGHQFMYYDYPVTHFIFSYDFAINELFTEIHELKTRENAEDYISRLSQVDRQVDQLLEGLKFREEDGVIPPDFIIRMALSNLHDYLGSRSNDPDSIDAGQLPVFYVFNDAIEDIPELSRDERMAFSDIALQEVESSFIPAYLKLIDYLEYLESIATNDAGVWKFPNGEEYYTYILRHETSTDLSPDEIHEIGLAEVERIKGEMREIFDELGYPTDENFGNSLGRAISEGGTYDTSTQTGKQVYIAEVEALIAKADQKMDQYFDLGPSWGVEVVGGRFGGYYTPGAADGSRPGAYHVGIESSRIDKFNQPTTAYHEAVPGHHYQIATAQALDLPMFRKEGDFNGFIEGWALYAERLAAEIGLYDDDPYGDIGRLQLELLRAVRLVTDTGIHAKGWTRQEAMNYMDDAMGAPGYFSYEVDRYVVIPGQATGYKIGMLKILELRQRAIDELGDQFDIKEFHNVVIGHGALPLEILEQLVDDYIQEKLNS
jgi:uncharacterized protein (DUF885 family)